MAARTIDSNQRQALEVSRESLHGRIAFAERATFAWLDRALAEGATIKTTPLTEEFTLADYQARHGEAALPLVAVSGKQRLRIFTPDDPPKQLAGWKLISLVQASPTSAANVAVQPEQKMSE